MWLTNQPGWVVIQHTIRIFHHDKSNLIRGGGCFTLQALFSARQSPASWLAGGTRLFSMSGYLI